MNRPLPIVRELRWFFVLPQILSLFILLVLGMGAAGIPYGLVIGALVYLVYSVGSRAILARHHKSGMRAMKAGRWEEAIAHFRHSRAFFEKYPWLDKYRQVFLMSPSGAAYHEMSLVNEAASLIELDRPLEAKLLYEEALQLYRDCPMAKAALKAMEAGAKVAQRGTAT